MRPVEIGVALAVAASLCLSWESLGSVRVKPSFFRTKVDTVVCETPFQIRKAIVAMAQDDGAYIRSLACTRPGAGKKVRLISMPVTVHGPLELQLVTEQVGTGPMWGYADQFEIDPDQ